KQFPISLPTDIADTLATVQRPDRNLALSQVRGEHTGVVGNRAQRSERALSLLVELVGVRHFGNAANDDLGAQGEGRPHVLVDPFLQLELAKGVFTPGHIADGVTRSVRRNKRALQALR